MQSMLDTVSDMDRMFNVDNILDDQVKLLKLPLVLGADANLSSYNSFQLPDFGDDFSSVGETQEDKSPQMYHTTDQGHKTSPWHESDSGMSEALSFTGSPLGGMNEDMMIQPDFLLSDFIPESDGNLSVEQDLSKFLLDEGLGNSAHVDGLMPSANYQDTTTSTHAQLTTTIHPVEPEENKSKRPVRKCVSQRKKIDSSLVNVDTSDTDEDYEVDRVSKSTKNQKKELNYFSEAKFSPRSDIKIVRVVKPVSATGDTSADDIMNALNERSKKNAIQAKINREKKKAYINSLETDLKSLQKDNESLSSENKQMKEDMTRLEEEIDYLKSVLANASALSGLLKNLNNVKEVKLSASIVGRKRGADEDHSYNLVESPPEKRARMVRENLKKAGVCLHVSDGEACLEFCAHCASLARKTHSHS